MSESEFQIRPATIRDIPAILKCIKGLARYEHLEDTVIATEADLQSSLFGETPDAEVLIAYERAEPAGFAVFFHNYSTFLARRGLYLEDLFVFPQFRGKGLGRSLLSKVARIAVQRQCGRFELSALDWNQKAIGFYERLGAQTLPEWQIYRWTEKALKGLADR